MSRLRFHAIKLAIPAIVTLGTIFASQPAHATFIFSFVESGTDVVETGIGTVNISDLTYSVNTDEPAFILPSLPYTIGGDPAATYLDIYAPGAIGPSVGTGGFTLANIGSGDKVGFINSQIMVPTAYVSGMQLSNTDTYFNETFASLGMTIGSYTYNYGTGSNADTFVINVGQQAAPVPEPSTTILFASALLFIGLHRKHRA